MSNAAATILIVDDELTNRRLLEALLRPEGYLSVSVASGEAALEAVAANPPDLILLDLMLPGMDGYQVIRTLKADPATSNIPIIMVTAQIDRSARLAGLAAGAEEFLSKPIDRAELWLRVRNLLRLKAFGNSPRSAEPLDPEAHFSGFMDSSPVLAWVSDESGRFLYTNKAWDEVLGADPRDESGNDRTSVEKTAMIRKLAAPSEALLQAGEVVERPFWIPKPDGTFRCWKSIKFPIREASGRVLVGGIGIDITQQKLAEIEVLNLTANLEQRIIDRTAQLVKDRDLSDRSCAEKCELLAVMSRELRGPLEAMAALMDGLDGCSLREEQQALVDEVRRSAVGLKVVADGLLAPST